MEIEQYEQILNYITTLAPIITAVAGMIISIIVSIKRYGKLSDNSVQKINELAEVILKDNAETKQATKQLKNEIYVLQKENQQLKKEIAKKQRPKVYNDEN